LEIPKNPSQLRRRATKVIEPDSQIQGNLELFAALKMAKDNIQILQRPTPNVKLQCPLKVILREEVPAQ